MKRLALAVLCIVGFSTSAYAEKILCVDRKHQPHSVEFIGDNIDFVYVDKLQYDYVGDSKDGKTITYTDDKHDIKFIVDPENRDWFFLTKSTKATKGKKSVEQFYALCDNVHVVEEEPQPKLVLNK